MTLQIVLTLVGGFAGGALTTFFLRGRAIDNEVRVAHVLATAVLSTTAGWMSGFEISEQAKVGSGSMYAILAKFERMGAVESRQEESRVYPHPRRRLYRWTAGAPS